MSRPLAWMARRASDHRPDQDGLHWARVGDQVLLWSADDRSSTDRGVDRAEGLALVVQVGRSFQDEHPDVRVLLDHGRQLVVDTGSWDGAGEAETTCWRIGPLAEDAVVVDRPDPAPARQDPAILALTAQLSTDAFEADLLRLVALGTRHSLSPEFIRATDGAAAQLTALGYTTTRSSITVGTGRSENVVAGRPGTGTGSRALVLVTAHLDSVNTAGGPAAPAPGADDNGSGSAGLLELARVLAGQAWTHDLRLVLFGGEEQGLHGSRQYVAALPAEERTRIRAVLNMDMIATRNTAEPAVLLEGAPLSSGLIDDLATAAATYTGLRVETSLAPFASDHVPFLDAGIPAVLTIEGADSANANIHTAQDTMEHIDLPLAREILTMNLAALASWLEPECSASPDVLDEAVGRA